MRLVTYLNDRNEAIVGCLVNGQVYALADIWTTDPIPSTMRDLLSQANWRERLQSALNVFVGDGAPDSGYHLDTIKLCAPVPDPSKVIAIGANTWSHVREAAELTNANPPERPLLILKAPSSVIGPRDEVLLPQDSQQVDYEVELAVVIGAEVRSVPEETSLQYVAGFTVANDLTARDFQLGDQGSNLYIQHAWAKSCDTFCPLGPVLVTPDEAGPVSDLRLSTKLNGETMQDGTGTDFIFSVQEIISFISKTITLVPGDVILSGSPAGVGIFRNPPRFLRSGDVVECSVSGIGSIENTIVDTLDSP